MLKTEDEKYQTLISSLQLIALPFEDQVRVLPKFVCQSDEVALIFDEAYRLFTSSLDKAPISADVLSLLEKLDLRFDSMSKNRELWSIEMLKSSEEWTECRTLARTILNKLHEVLDEPSLDFIRFIETS
jgi:hypothetical protein